MLGTLGGNYSEGYYVTDGGVVVGDTGLTGNFDYHPFRWTQAGGMTDVGTLGGRIVTVQGISADGSVIVGMSDLFGGGQHAYRWTQAGGIVDLGTLGGSASNSGGVSADGSVVVGSASLAGDTATHAFRWTQAGGMSDLGTLGGTYSGSNAVSSDGSVVVGSASLAGGASRAFRWTQAGGMVDLGTLGGSSSVATDISADGNVVVGSSTNVGGATRAFHWTQAGGMVDLGTLGGGFIHARDLSSDGGVVVGVSTLGSGDSHAFRWTQGGGMADLGTLGGSTSVANDVSADGSVVVGYSTTAGGVAHAFRWSETVGMADLNTLLSNAGVDMTGIVLGGAYGVSPDGQYITGFGSSGGADQAFFVYFTENAAGVTTEDAQHASARLLADRIQSSQINSRSRAKTLLGISEPSIRKSFVSAGTFITDRFGYIAGQQVRGQWTILGAVLYGDENSADVSSEAGTQVALGVRRYLSLSDAPLQPYFEVGGWATSEKRLSLERDYLNGSSTAIGRGRTASSEWNEYFKGGVTQEVTDTDTLNAWVMLTQHNLRFDGYSESSSGDNPFPATIAGGTARMIVTEAGASWRHRLDDRYIVTLSGVLAQSHAVSSDVELSVAPVGTFAGSAQKHTWGEYGIRFQAQIAEQSSLTLTSQGRVSIGTTHSNQSMIAVTYWY